MTVTKEMIEAGLRITLSSVNVPAGECLHETDVREILEAALSSRSAEAGKPVVKGLEWYKPLGNTTLSRADTILGSYRVWTYSEANGEWFWNGGNGDEITAASEEAAKAAAQADYEARIRAALSTPAAAAVGEPGPMQHVRAHAHLVRCFAEEMTARNWADKALYIKQQADFIISAIDAAPSSPEGWQPIETAPKDGTVIMAWHTVHDCPMAVVWKEPGHPFNGEVLNWYEKSYTTAWPEKCFSHWKPLLPAPPALGGKP